MTGVVGLAATAAACFLTLACASNEAEPNEATSSAPSAQITLTAVASSRGDATPGLPLYGAYIDLQHNEWAIHFEDREAWVGELEVWHVETERGRAYTYGSDSKTLRLEAATQPKDVMFRLGGFNCRPDGPATYEWWRFDRNYTLWLTALHEPCPARRAILEGDWHFLD